MKIFLIISIFLALFIIINPFDAHYPKTFNSILQSVTGGNSSTLKSNEKYSIEEIIENLNRLCLVSTKYSIKATGGVGVRLFKTKGGRVSGEYIETDINGFLENLQGVMAQKELSELRQCIEPFRAKIMSKLLGEEVGLLDLDLEIKEEITQIINDECEDSRLIAAHSLAEIYPDNKEITSFHASISEGFRAYKARRKHDVRTGLEQDYGCTQKQGGFRSTGYLCFGINGIDDELNKKRCTAYRYLQAGDSLMKKFKFKSAIIKYKVANKSFSNI